MIVMGSQLDVLCAWTHIYKHYGNTTNLRNHLKRKHLSIYMDNCHTKKTKSNITRDKDNDIFTTKENEPSTSRISNSLKKKQESKKESESTELQINKAFEKVLSYTGNYILLFLCSSK